MTLPILGGAGRRIEARSRKNAIGIEVPNKKRSSVMRDVLEAAHLNAKARFPWLWEKTLRATIL
ncbi:MAG: hypothetical protein ACLT0Y_05310 [Christensenellales bacterium]